eukprot:g16579.t1
MNYMITIEAVLMGMELGYQPLLSDFTLLSILKSTLKNAYDAQLIDCQFCRATVKNHNDLLRKQTRGTTDRVHFVIQYFPRAQKLHHILRSLQHIINDDEYLNAIFPMHPLLPFKQPPNLKQTIVFSKLPSLQDNIDHTLYNPVM